MKWISSEKCPPIYVWDLDLWYNETNKVSYIADTESFKWISFCGDIPFTKKTRIMR